MLFVVKKIFTSILFLMLQKSKKWLIFKVIVTILLSVSYNALYEKVLNKDSKGR